MKLRYKELFKIGFATTYYVDGQTHDEVLLEPTWFCSKKMSRYKLLSRKSSDGISVYYEASPLTNDATAFKPIKTEEKFAFKAVVNDPNLWYYADVNGWQQDRLYFLSNTVYNTLGDIVVLNGALNASVLNRPLIFTYDLPLQTDQSLLEIRDATSRVIKSIVIRARFVDEVAGKREKFLVDLKTNGDGLYTLTQVKKDGNIDERVYCSTDYSEGTFAIVEITYQGGLAWTGVTPIQNYQVTLITRATEWVYDVYIRPKPMNPLIANKLFIKHLPIGAEPMHTFSVITSDNITGYVQFKSDGPLRFSQRPMNLRLVLADLVTLAKGVGVLPVPSSHSIVKSGSALSTRIIVNI